MLKRGQAEPVPLPGREGAGQESCPKQPRPLLQHPAAPGCFRGLSDTPKPPNPRRVSVLGESLSQQRPSPWATLSLPVHSVCGKTCWATAGCIPQATTAGLGQAALSPQPAWGLESCFLFFLLEQKNPLRFHAIVRRCQRLQCCRGDGWFGTAVMILSTSAPCCAQAWRIPACSS